MVNCEKRWDLEEPLIGLVLLLEEDYILGKLRLLSSNQTQLFQSLDQNIDNSSFMNGIHRRCGLSSFGFLLVGVSFGSEKLFSREMTIEVRNSNFLELTIEVLSVSSDSSLS